MYIAIDDTYGPIDAIPSVHVTGARRTHVAVVFQDNEIDEIRIQVNNCLDYLGPLLPSPPMELHFVDIYNRKGVWENLEGEANLKIFEAFAEIYKHYRWKVFLQTIDDRTIKDHPELLNTPSLDGLNVENRAELSLLLLCHRIRFSFKQSQPPINLIVDQGACSPDTPFGKEIFAAWGTKFSGKYESSSAEPLLQIADFFAFIINRQAHLSLKENRTETDKWLLSLVGQMNINCDELLGVKLPADFTVEEFDAVHQKDRDRKRLK